MILQDAYIIVDVGTGNLRVAVAAPDGTVISVAREDIRYEKDNHYPDALYFDPEQLWEQIILLTKNALQQAPDVRIKAITATSQREGIVLADRKGKALTGLPNIDHRGREWEHIIPDKDRVYALTGRYPTSLFSALKLTGIQKRSPELWRQVALIMSISDWVQYQWSGVAGYEPSQASETLLYDVAAAAWCDELCAVFDVSPDLLPPLLPAGTLLGKVRPEYAAMLNISGETMVIAGGADTQLAVKSTQPSVEDIVIVSGTTTPVIRITNAYLLDGRQRTWTNRHVEAGKFILETNAGVTGLNYQQLKAIFYPHESYEIIEEELAAVDYPACTASLGSLVADEETALTKGGFVFHAPVSRQLTRADFVWAILWDIACSIKLNYDSLCDVVPYMPDYIWGCGGGFQSSTLSRFIASLINKQVRLRKGFHHSSVTGGVIICNEAFGIQEHAGAEAATIYPQQRDDLIALFEEWKATRRLFSGRS